MKIPNFASWYHCGAWNLASDAQEGANGPRAATASTRRTVSATPGSCASEEVPARPGPAPAGWRGVPGSLSDLPRILIWDDRSSLIGTRSFSSRPRGAEEAAVEVAGATVDHSDIRGSSSGLAIMVVIRRELPPTTFVGRDRSPAT